MTHKHKQYPLQHLADDCVSLHNKRCNNCSLVESLRKFKPEVHRFVLDDETTWPDQERDGEYVLVKFKNDEPNYYEYPYEIKRTEFVPNYTGVVAWVRMTDFFKAIEKELGE